MLFSPRVSVLDETPMCSTTRNQLLANTSPPPSHRKPVSAVFHFHLYATPISCQPLPADEDEQDGPSTETSSLLSGPGDIVDDDDDAVSKKSTHSHCIDITGLALLYKPEFWQLWVLMGLLTGVGLMTIK